jgi:ElaB/YqjD/DUF883 family membrane-anchored ribosome-binding protein
MDNQPASKIKNASDHDHGLGAGIRESLEQAATTARNSGEQAWSAAATAGDAAQDLVRGAREQASAARDTLYAQGTRAAGYLTRNVDGHPLTALLVAGAIGYMAAYLFHTRRPGEQ